MQGSLANGTCFNGSIIDKYIEFSYGTKNVNQNN